METRKNRRIQEQRSRRLIRFSQAAMVTGVLGLICLMLALLVHAYPASGHDNGSPEPAIADGTAAAQDPEENTPPIRAQAETARPGEPEESWKLTLVNATHSLPEGHSIDLETLGNGERFDARAYPALAQMLSDMKAQGLSPIVCSAFRAHEEQVTLFQNQTQRYLDLGYSQEEAEREAGYMVAVPGTSEHELGLAADIVAESNQLLDESQEQTAEQQWLMKHCTKYGFILRYPSDKSEITGIGYEPWHYRYVGEEAAKEITESGLCLEEYLGNH